ncbi:Serine/threonine-protein kinase [Chytridiales sp. JEL 0842]|nr:Serine/threonine-protein kinase [Chytridiales sp. JEL 0842]
MSDMTAKSPVRDPTSNSNSSHTQNLAGEYVIGEEIGRGSFATVFVGRAANPTKVPQVVAIKSVLREKLNRKLAENLESEIKILKGIKHDNIVGLLDIVKTDRHIHLIMEFCSMGDLSAYIKKKGNIGLNSTPGRSSTNPAMSDPSINPIAGPWGGLSEYVVRHYLRQLSAAMEFLRANSLIHRDLKPQNLLLNPPPPNSPPLKVPNPVRQGQFSIVPALPVLKLADFGFARALPQQSLASTLCGSPLYMAPEILRGDRYDAKADLWSLGAILYEMLVGRPPFKAQNHVELLRRIDRTDTVKFPGDDNGEAAARKSMMIGNAQISSSPRTGSALPMGSLGSSPRFPSVMQGAMAIADDLKDLIRRLLKKNPIERMSFEEFFMHPAVISNRGLSTYFEDSDDGAAPLDFRKVRDENTQPVADSSPKVTVLQSRRTSVETPQRLQEQAALNRRRSVVTSNNENWSHEPPTQVSTSTSRHASITSTPVPSSPLRTVPTTNIPPATSDAILYHFHGELPQKSETTSSRASSRRPSSVSEPQPISLASMPEPPFAGYQVNPSGMFLDLEVRTPQPQPTPSDPQQQPPQPLPNSQDPDKDPSSSLSSPSSLGSLELSDEGLDDKERLVHIIRKNPTSRTPSPPSNTTAAVQPTRVPQPPPDSPNQHEDPRQTPSLTQSSSIPSHMLASQQQVSSPHLSETSNTGASSSGISANKASLDEYVVVEKRVVEVNWLADEVAASTTVGGGGGSPLGTSPRGNSVGVPRRGGSAGSLPISGTSAIAVPMKGVVDGGAGTYGSPSTPPSPRTLRSVGRTGSRSSEPPQGKGRIFGSLRDSAHNFLETSTSPLGGGNLPQNSQLVSASGAPSVQPQPLIPGQNALPPSTWITGYEDDASLLTTLNLCVLRGHAINELADSRYRDLVAPSKVSIPQTLVGSSTASTSISEKAIDATPTDLHAAEEALGLYLTALGLYQLGIEAARLVWSREQARMTTASSTLATLSASFLGGVKALTSQGSSSQSPQGNTNAFPNSASLSLGGGPMVNLESLSASVQWIRERFNECLDRAQDVRGVIGADSEDASRAQDSTGARPVERVVYERALELARKAAAAENKDGNIQLAEAGYTQAVILLEAILYVPPAPPNSDPAEYVGMSENDRLVIERFVGSLGKKLEKLREVQFGPEDSSKTRE